MASARPDIFETARNIIILLQPSSAVDCVVRRKFADPTWWLHSSNW